jgi:hypothetical protein
VLVSLVKIWRRGRRRHEFLACDSGVGGDLRDGVMAAPGGEAGVQRPTPGGVDPRNTQIHQVVIASRGPARTETTQTYILSQVQLRSKQIQSRSLGFRQLARGRAATRTALELPSPHARAGCELAAPLSASL